MIEGFTKAWFDNLEKTRSVFLSRHPKEYIDIVKIAVASIQGDYTLHTPKTEAEIIQLGGKDYSGRLVFILSGGCNDFWYSIIDYGSCSACDTLLGIRDYCGRDEAPTTDQIDEYMTLTLHVVQSIKKME
jgi:hypothetical protein